MLDEGEQFREDLAAGRVSLAKDAAPARVFDLDKPADRRAFDVAIRRVMKEGGLSYNAATAHLSNRATFGDKPPDLNVHDPVTRAKLHAEAMKRVKVSQANAAGSDGRNKAIGFSDALSGVFTDIARGQKVEGLS